MVKGEKTLYAENKAKSIPGFIDKNDIFDWNLETPEELEDYIKELDEQQVFSDGLKQAIIKSGYMGSVDDRKALLKYIRNKFEVQGLDRYYIKDTLNNWLDGNPVDDSYLGRERVYNVCMALDMSLEETEVFFKKYYLQRPFNFRRADEIIYYYCIKNAKKYIDVQRILEKTKSYVEIDDPCSTQSTIATEMINKEIDRIHNEEELIEYIRNNNINGGNHSCQKVTMKLLESINKIDYFYDINIEEDEKKKKKEITIKDLLRIFYGGELKNNKDVESSILGKIAFPTEVDFSNIRNDGKEKTGKNGNVIKYVSSDVYRRTIILLTFFEYFSSLSYKLDTIEMDSFSIYENFIILVNKNLYEAGLPELYYRNKFDWLFAYCAYRNEDGDDKPDAIETFHEMIKGYVDRENAG